MQRIRDVYLLTAHIEWRGRLTLRVDDRRSTLRPAPDQIADHCVAALGVDDHVDAGIELGRRVEDDGAGWTFVVRFRVPLPDPFSRFSGSASG